MEIIDIKGYTFYNQIFYPVESNMYVMICGEEALIFDAIESEDVIELLINKNISKVHIFLTHEHYDHSHGVECFKKHFNTTLYCHENCLGNLSTKKRSSPRLVSFVLSVMDMKDGGSRHDDFRNKYADYDLDAEIYLQDASVLTICGHKINTVHVPGHTPGSVLYIMDDILAFTGDSLIENNKIITGFRGGNKEEMLEVSIPKLKALPNNIWVLPGHGKPFKKINFDFGIYNV